MSQSVEVECAIKAIGFLVQAVADLGFAIHDLSKAKGELKKLEGCDTEVDYVIDTKEGEKIGVKQNTEGNYEFVVAKSTASTKKTIDKVTQTYARLKILDEVKRKGYKSVKEEKLANGSIRLVVEKWQ